MNFWLSKKLSYLFQGVLGLALCLLAPLQLSGQSCTTSVCNAATMNQADVVAAWPAPSNSNSIVTLNLPAGTGTWTSQVTLTVPAAVTSLIIQGASSVSCSGTAGTSGYACIPTDSSIIVDNIPAQFGVWQINGSSGTNPLIRFTGVTIKGGTGLQKFQGLLLFYSNNSGSQLRIDHSHFNSTTYTGSGAGAWAGRINNCFTGVIDHNVVDSASTTNTTSVVQGFFIANTCNDTSGYGDGSWATASGYGGLNFLFEESNVFNGGLVGDSDIGGKVVYRYNTINSSSQSSSWVHNHGTETNGGRVRGTRAMEIYKNYFHIVSGTGSVLVGSNGGSAMIWGNTASTATALFSGLDNERNDGGHHETATPNGWGFCGTSTIDPNTGSANGVGSAWDGNSPATTGVPCLDGLGRGFTAQALNGQNFPSALNSVTGTIAWPQQYLEPIYEWMNTLAGTPQVTINSPAAILNRDVYVDNASFTGATGTGFGLLSARPSTCTAGPGGTYGASPTGSYGVAYFGTDTNTLYVCTAANTWTPVYTPAVYPHPLVSGTTLYTWTPTVSPSGGGTITGSNAAGGAYAAGTPMGPFTATANSGYVFSGWTSAFGSATCTGSTNPTTSFNLNADSGCTANFTAVTPSYSFTVSAVPSTGGSVATSGNCSNGSKTSGTSISCTPTATTGNFFTTWSGTGSAAVCNGTSTIPCVFSITANSTLQANFSSTPQVPLPTFTPGGGSYSSPQSVALGDPLQTATTVMSMDVTSNNAASNGDTVGRNLYTNCAESCSGGVPQPPNGGGVSHGQLWCRSSEVVSCGSFGSGFVNATVSGTGTKLPENGQGAGGDDSATAMTATFGGANASMCPIGTNLPSGIAGLTYPGNVSGGHAVLSVTSDGTNFNTSLLAPNKYVNTSADSGRYWYRELCIKVNTTSVAGEHFEWDDNYNDTAGSYTGPGMHFVFSSAGTGGLYYCMQGCSGWKLIKLKSIPDGATTTSLTWPANHNIYARRYEHRNAGCTYSSGSQCVFYDAFCFQDLTAGTPLHCYQDLDNVTNTTPGGIPVNKTTWTRNEFAIQHQWDVNGPSATVTATIDFDNFVAYSLSSPAVTIYYTTDGSTPTTSSKVYIAPILVTGNMTIRAMATAPGYTNSNVATAVYTFGGSIVDPIFSPTSLTSPGRVSITDTTSGSTIYYTTDGSTPTTSSAKYTHPLFVSQSETIQAIAVAGSATSGVVSQTYTLTPKVRFSLAATSSGVTPSPTPLDTRGFGVGVATIEPTRGSYSFTAVDAWISQAISSGATFTYTVTGFPTWMTGQSSTMAAPPTDLNTSGTCVAPLAGVVTTDCSMKEFITALVSDRTGLSTQPANPVLCPGLDYLEIANIFNVDGAGDVGWTGTYAQLAKLANDISTVTHNWCSNTVVVAGSVSALVGSNSSGEDGHYDVALRSLLTNWTGLSSPSLPDAVSFHGYPAAFTVSPVPFPTSLVSNSDTTCTSGNTPNAFCYIPVAQEVSAITGAGVLLNVPTRPWTSGLAVLNTEGGFGALTQLCSLSSGSFLCQAYVSQYMLTIAAQQPNALTTLLYAANDSSFGCYWNCGSGTSAWLSAFTTTQTQLNSCTVAGTLTSTAVSGGNIWKLPMICTSGTSEIDWFDGYLTTTTFATSAWNSMLNLGTGVSGSPGSSVALGQQPILFRNTFVPPPSPPTNMGGKVLVGGTTLRQ